MENTSHISRFVTQSSFVALVFIFLSFPSVTLGHSIRDAEEHQGFYVQGDGADFDQWSDWWGRRSDNATRQAIEALGSEKVLDLSIPILLGVEVSELPDNFGEPRGGGTRTHEGHDTHAPKDTPVVSPTAAVVTRIAEWANAGKVVYTANPGGETFVYMHLNRFAEGLSEGDVLGKGDLVGYVGNTGNAVGAGDHLHFEIREGGIAKDPLPRLTQEFSIEEKMQFLGTILDKQVDRASYVSFINNNFQEEIQRAINAGVELPEGTMLENPGSTSLPSTQPLTSGPEYAGSKVSFDMTIGERGDHVVWLQEFLISQDKGERARYLARSTATGYFGSITQSALAEYQRIVGISPASGYYGPLTRRYISSFATNDDNNDNDLVEQEQDKHVQHPMLHMFTRDLGRGLKGEDVRALQQLLNNRGFIVAQSGYGSPGNETDYFGPATQDALARFQAANSISPPVGYFGPITREVIATL